MSVETTITIKNSIEQIQSVIDCFESFGKSNSMSMKSIMQLNIALDEFISNTIKYAFEGDESEHEITIDFKLAERTLTTIIKDDGIEFDPFGRNPPDTKLGLEERKVGGLGIHITKELMDDYSYDRKNGVNTILLIKNNVK
jgi:anti-sigma regulatory factor (Ser/Thr protein kinase)